MSDLNFQNFSTVQSDAMSAGPNTIASTTTIAPTNFLTFISGTVAIATITPPVSGAHMLCFIATTASPTAFVTTGNVQTAVAMVQSVPCFLVYSPTTAKYYGK